LNETAARIGGGKLVVYGVLWVVLLNCLKVLLVIVDLLH
jgi:hypothetical protein